MPFQNHSQAPGLEWIGESFPELLQPRLTSSSTYVLTREDRIKADDRLGIPSAVDLSRATIYRIAEQMDVDVVVLGDYNFDGRTFTATAQLLDMRHEHLLPKVTESGPLTDLINIETAIAWDILHIFRPDLSITRQAYLEATPPVRLDAFENYIRGVIATSADEKISRFRQALRLKPDYSQALLQLGKAYYRDQQYDQAVSVLERVPLTDPLAREANFFLGLSAYYQRDYDRAEAAFKFVASRLPLTEVYNNLGVVQSRLSKNGGLEYFQKAVDTDPNDPDYRFNLGVELYRGGDLAGASRQLRAALSLQPDDSEAKLLLDSIGADATAKISQTTTSSARKIPAERIRPNYDESSFRQLALKIAAAAEQRLAKADPATHAQFHADRGHELLAQGFLAEAEKQFRESISLDSSNAEAHAGLAGVLEGNGDFSGARSEAEAALRLRQFPEPMLVLARLDLRDNRLEEAARNVDDALRLDPLNAQAQTLKRAIAAKLAEKAQPLPSQ